MNVHPHLQMDKPTFLAWVQGREGRYELAGRRVVMITGGSMAHAKIVRNLLLLLHGQCDQQKLNVIADFGVDLGPDTLRYPDVLVVPAGVPRKSLTVTDPVFIAEVISPSSATVDLGDKATEYLRLPSLFAYLVLDQDEPKAWLWMREPEGFSPGPAVIAGQDAVMRIGSLGVELGLSEIYAGIED